MVFVHARNATVRTATALRDLASSRGDLQHFQPEQSPQLGLAEKQVGSTTQCVHSVSMGFQLTQELMPYASQWFC